MPPKRKPEDEEAGTEDAAPSKRASKKKQASTEPYFCDEWGWNVRPPSLLWREYQTEGIEPTSKIAAFDFDGTLCHQKSTARAPKDADDWKLFNKHVPKVLREHVAEGYKIVVFSNQNAIKGALSGKAAMKVMQRINNVMEAAGVPAQVFVATGKDELRKPEVGMWTFFCENCNGGLQPDLSESFFTGDAAGRVGDFADSDKVFAANVGLPFKLPEDVFGPSEGKRELLAPPGDAAAAGEGAAGAEVANPELAAMFDALMEKHAGDTFKVNAFRKVAAVIRAYPTKITSGKEMAQFKGVGKGSVSKIDEFLATGTCAELLGEGGEEFKPKVDKRKVEASVALKFM